MVKSLQRIAEERSYEILFELENEIGIDTGKLPEIYYVGGPFAFGKLGIKEEIGEEYFDLVKKNKAGCCFRNHNVILLATLKKSVLAEEVGHFIHFSNLKNKNRNLLDLYFTEMIVETLGYFSSRLISNSRKNVYEGTKDEFEKLNFNEIFQKILDVSKEGYLNQEYLIYNQAYPMGEKLFDKYLNNDLSKNQIREIFLDPLKNEEDSFYWFMRIKNNLLK